MTRTGTLRTFEKLQNLDPTDDEEGIRTHTVESEINPFDPLYPTA